MHPEYSDEYEHNSLQNDLESNSDVLANDL